MKTLFTVVTLLSLNAFASVFERDSGVYFETLGLLGKVRSKGQLQKALSENQNRQDLRALCEAQLRAGRVPGACFTKLKHEQMRRQVNRAQFVEVLGRIESLCLVAARAETDAVSLAEALKTFPANSECGKALRQRLGDLEYQSVENDPVGYLAGAYHRAK